MARTGTSERRNGGDRRKGGASSYTGPERRREYRRKTDFIACIHCKKVCDASGSWGPKAATPDTATRFRAGICPECASKGFTPFYPDD